MIPQTIHQTWETRCLPPTLAHYHASWVRLNPTWRVSLYDSQMRLDFVRDAYPEFLPVYQGFAHTIQRADFFRYLIVYRYGGLYADIDMECLRPLGPFDPSSTAIFSVEEHITRQRQRELGYREPFQIANCIFATAPQHWFLAHMIEQVVQTAHQPAQTDAAILATTGPWRLTRLYFALAPEAQRQLTILPQIYWMPPTSYPNWWPLNRNMVARHHFMGSWKSEDAKELGVYRRWVERSRLPNPWPHRRAKKTDSR